MFDSAINYIDKFGPELLIIQFGLLVILSCFLLWLWFSNRRKYQNLNHLIPANVLKNYLDSIIQNSQSLQSSLFRGTHVNPSENVPSVMPLTGLYGGDSVGIEGTSSTALLEELNQKKAFIASLEAQLSSTQVIQRQLESRIDNLNKEVSSAEEKIKELEALLAKSNESGGGDESLREQLNHALKERDELKDKLKEFEIIADDLANLKKLQQENSQLKQSLKISESNKPTIKTATKNEALKNEALKNEALKNEALKNEAINNEAINNEDINNELSDIESIDDDINNSEMSEKINSSVNETNQELELENLDALVNSINNDDKNKGAGPKNLVEEDRFIENVQDLDKKSGESSKSEDTDINQRNQKNKKLNDENQNESVSKMELETEKSKNSKEKTPEDLLSEFEKMLG